MLVLIRNGLGDKTNELFRRILGVEEHKEEVYSLLRLRQLFEGLDEISPVVEVALGFLL